jgi:hypothetical protein
MKIQFQIQFHEGFAEVYYEGKSGLINRYGQEVITPKYDLLSDVRSGILTACYDKKCGVIDTLGTTLIPFEYEATHLRSCLSV